MRFKFRLARVLNYLSLKETVKKMEVAAVVREIALTEQRVLELEADLRQLLEEGPKRFAEGMQWASFQVNRIAADRRDIEVLAKKLNTLQEDLQEKRGELAKLAMRRQAMENLRDKRKAEFKLDQSRRDQKQMDELFQGFRKD